MKIFALLFSIGILFVTSFSQATCVDLTGDYDSLLLNGSKGSLVWSLKQNGCDSIALGSYYQLGTVKADEVVPTILYVHRNKPELCKKANCFVFTETNGGVEYAEYGTVPVNGTDICSYNKVELFLDGQDLAHRFSIYDNTAHCRNLKYHTIVFKRVL